jgi:Photoprotection regulator fluorescence recovery protein
MDQPLTGWSESEETIARQAFERAYERALASLIQHLRDRLPQLSSAESLWELHDFLSIQRHAIEGRFDFREPGLLFVFAGLLKDQLISLEELQGLEAIKLAKISAMTRI